MIGTENGGTSVAVIGGLIYSLFLTFYFMPAAYGLIEARRSTAR